MNYIYHYNSFYGKMTLASDGEELIGLWFDNQKNYGETVSEEDLSKGVSGEGQEPLPIFKETERWLDLYFFGGLPDKNPKYKLIGTPFQKEVWEITAAIPYGKRMSYGEIARIMTERREEAAKSTGEAVTPVSPRAVGQALAHNPIALIVPCHRVVGAGGDITGYAAGATKKEQLINLEASVSIVSHPCVMC